MVQLMKLLKGEQVNKLFGFNNMLKEEVALKFKAILRQPPPLI